MIFAYEDTPGMSIVGGGDHVSRCSDPFRMGFITLSLFLLSFGTIYIGRKESALSIENGTTQLGWRTQRPPFHADLFKKSLVATGILATIAGLFSIWIYGSITAVDFMGTLITGPLFAYLIAFVNGI